MSLNNCKFKLISNYFGKEFGIFQNFSVGGGWKRRHVHSTYRLWRSALKQMRPLDGFQSNRSRMCLWHTSSVECSRLAQCVSRDLMKFTEISADVAMIRWNLLPTCRVGLTNCWIELKLCVRRWTFTGTRTASNADAATVDWAKSVPRCTRAPTWSSANATTSGNFYSPKIFTFTKFHFPSTALQLKWINYFLKN